MNCIISSETTDVEQLKTKLAAVPDMDGLELASHVSTKEAYEKGDKDSPVRIAVMDYGIKRKYYRVHGGSRSLCKSISGKDKAGRSKEI